jgi:hypothetical protein
MGEAQDAHRCLALLLEAAEAAPACEVGLRQLLTSSSSSSPLKLKLKPLASAPRTMAKLRALTSCLERVLGDALRGKVCVRACRARVCVCVCVCAYARVRVCLRVYMMCVL